MVPIIAIPNNNKAIHAYAKIAEWAASMTANQVKVCLDGE